MRRRPLPGARGRAEEATPNASPDPRPNPAWGRRAPGGRMAAARGLLLAAAAALLLRAAAAQTYIIGTKTIIFYPRNVQEHTELQIDLEFDFALSAGAGSKITIALPRMTCGAGDGTPGTPPSTIQMTHTTYFTPTWTEGTYSYADPYPDTKLELVVDRAMAANTQLSIKIDADNGFMFHCGINENEGIKISVTDDALGALVTDELMDHTMVGPACTNKGTCFGHGTCDACRDKCVCDDGYGSTSDVYEIYVFPDCSERVCPKGRAWGDVPTGATAAHADAECSNRGVCDRTTGICACVAGFGGEACQKKLCPNDCSGHGLCMNMHELGGISRALPLVSSSQVYGSSANEATTAWDSLLNMACVCDSSWSVGLASGETQEPEWFGADCSLKRCPTGDDPMTSAVETDCSGVAPVGGSTTGATGASGNLCHVDCSNRGKCDHTLGTCTCFEGFHGENCGYQLFAYNTK
uniref:EGF-like domain-containing protein n=1 Tax=Phaeomonas parva TaxID=124430 RepID=A0A7S1UJF5_9STRA|mmetsp:Transcript_8592/g.24867  ORF Transcript_8592/g.24867 Transcript_8592/m.24867 type:complete len:467 (+) Transcript_8592:156-1556(+)